MTRLAKRAACIVALLIFSWHTMATANGLLRDGVGARSSGRGGTNLGFADTGSVLLDNPGGMVNIAGCELLEVGGDILFTDLQYSDPDNPRTSAFNNPLPMGQFALLRKTADGLGAYGLGVYSQAGLTGEFLLEGPAPFGGERLYKSFGALLRVLPGASYRLTDRLAVGGNLGVGISHIELEAPYTLQSLPLMGTPTMLDLQSTGAGLSWALGLQYELSPKTTLGLAYQGETRMQLDGNARVETTFMGQSYYDVTVDWVWPRSLGLGIQHRPCCHRRWGLDVIWYDWSHAMDRLDLLFSDPQNPIFAAVAGPQVPDSFPLRWRDSISVRVGREQAISDSEVVRLGYVYQRNPIPDSTLTNYIVTTLEHAFSAGYGWRSGKYQFDLAYQYSFGRSRRSPASEVVGGDFLDARVLSQVHWLMFSVIRN